MTLPRPSARAPRMSQGLCRLSVYGIDVCRGQRNLMTVNQTCQEAVSRKPSAYDHLGLQVQGLA